MCNVRGIPKTYIVRDLPARNALSSTSQRFLGAHSRVKIGTGTPPDGPPCEVRGSGAAEVPFTPERLGQQGGACLPRMRARRSPRPESPLHMSPVLELHSYPIWCKGCAPRWVCRMWNGVEKYALWFMLGDEKREAEADGCATPTKHRFGLWGGSQLSLGTSALTRVHRPRGSRMHDRPLFLFFIFVGDVVIGINPRPRL